MFKLLMKPPGSERFVEAEFWIGSEEGFAVRSRVMLECGKLALMGCHARQAAIRCQATACRRRQMIDLHRPFGLYAIATSKGSYRAAVRQARHWVNKYKELQL